MCMCANMLKICANIRKMCAKQMRKSFQKSSQSWSRQPILGSWDRVALSRSPPLGPASRTVLARRAGRPYCSGLVYNACFQNCRVQSVLDSLGEEHACYKNTIWMVRKSCHLTSFTGYIGNIFIDFQYLNILSPRYAFINISLYILLVIYIFL